MGLYKNFIDILRHTDNGAAFTKNEVVEALEKSGTNESNLENEIIERTKADKNLSEKIDKLNNTIGSVTFVNLEDCETEDFNYITDSNGKGILYTINPFKDVTHIYKKLKLTNLSLSGNLVLETTFATDHYATANCGSGGFNEQESSFTIKYEDGSVSSTNFLNKPKSTGTKVIAGSEKTIYTYSFDILSSDMVIKDIEIIYAAENFYNGNTDNSSYCSQDFWITDITYYIKSNNTTFYDRITALEKPITSDKIASGAITSDKIASGAVTADEVIMLDGSDMQSVIDNISDMLSGVQNPWNIIPLSECMNQNGLFSFTGDEIDNELAVLNDLEAGEYPLGDSSIDHKLNGSVVLNDENGNIQWLPSTYGDPIWLFSQTLESGKAYVIQIMQEPQSGADWNDGIITVREELYIDPGLEVRVSAIEKRMTSIGEGGNSGFDPKMYMTASVMTSRSYYSEGSNIYETITTDIKLEQDTKKYYQFKDNCGVLEGIGAGGVYSEYTIGGIDLVSIISDSGETGGITLETVVSSILYGGNSALHWNGSAWEIFDISTIKVNLTERVTALEKIVGTANAALEEILSGGV